MRLPTTTTHVLETFGRSRMGFLFLKSLSLPATLAVLVSSCGEPKDGGFGVDTQGLDTSEVGGTGTGTASQGSGVTGDTASAREIPECQGVANGTLCDQGQGICNAQQCVPMRCGDGVVSPANQEQCDDGNTVDGDGCSAQCLVESNCGNGVVEAGEACDAGAANGQPGSGCSATCQPASTAVCGNGAVEPGEQCDDGNRVGRDGCSTLCTLERCGNNVVDANEQCDDGNLVDGDGCSWMCTVERCGDGVLQPKLGEQCDDGNLNDDDGCDASCKLQTFCGNRVVEAPNENCDDGNQEDGDGCSAQCRLEAGHCGDGIAQATEECDDGNLVSGDGCSEYCQRENEHLEVCNKKVESQLLPARSSVVARKQPPAQFVYTSELFGRYRALCGGCHVNTNQGDFQTEAGTMDKVAREFEGHREAILRTMYAEDHTIMPPRAKPLSKLGEAAPAVVLASQLEAWYDQGLSADGFFWQGSPAPSHDGYQVDEDLSAKLTNIGSCEPNKEILHSDQHRSQRLDAFFEKAERWPEYLSETDFVSMDSKELAKGGVISYATTYQLWADNAKKMRHFKLPYGKKIRFNKEKQLFELPENTRIYKTFLKEVKDSEGKVSYRKMETRVILVRRDEIAEDGTATVKALYGSYKWNADETQAVLISTPLRNGNPDQFADDIFVYDVDEKKAHEIRRDTGPNETISGGLFGSGAVRHYVIPGSARCDECHLGSLEENFVVGFSPLQLNRRAKGEGGIIDEPYPGEINQLQRFIDWGLFENFDDVGEIRLLEAKQTPSYWSGKDALSPVQAKANAIENKLNPDAEPKVDSPQLSKERSFRNQSELEMQGYMLGNCAHCHNPRGYPSVREPSISSRLNMHPLTEGGGIFEFRLDNMSPRNERGGDLRIPVPYISPSLYDVYDQNSKSKLIVDTGFSPTTDEANYAAAPWRSLIYRNVDTPYTYVFSKTIFPHMPVHTPGYDCRIRDLSAKWMLSVPSRLKSPLSPDPAPKNREFYGEIYAQLFPDAEPLTDNEKKMLQLEAELNPQPWEEVYEGDSDYAKAVSDAELRVQTFLKGTRSTFECRGKVEPGEALPITTVEGANILSSSVFNGLRTEPYQREDSGLIMEPHLGPYDMTEVSGPWWPRRADWEKALVRREVECVERPTKGTPGDGVTGDDEKFTPYCATTGQVEEAILIDSVLENMTLDEGIKSLALDPVPLGLWDTKPECSFDGVPTVNSLPADERWVWMKGLTEEEKNRPIYLEPAGATLFKSVCAQCHGRKGDSQGAMANTLNELTGGESVVANFENGMFGPADDQGKNILRRFKSAAENQNITAEDMAARYMAWMSLGGTRSVIHSAILNIVNSAGILGQPRPAVGAATDANMLNVAKEICGAFVSYNADKPTLYNLISMKLPDLEPKDGALAKMPVIGSLADAQVWYRICTYNNPMPIRILGPEAKTGSPRSVPTWYSIPDQGVSALASPGFLLGKESGWVKREYGMGEPMLNNDGLGEGARVEIMTDATIFPLCVRRPAPEYFDVVEDRMKSAVVDGKQAPFCPEEWSEWDLDTYAANDINAAKTTPQLMTRADLREWVMRGAANAGFMVYAFTKELIAGRASLQVDYNRCEDLPKSSGESSEKPKGETGSSIAR